MTTSSETIPAHPGEEDPSPWGAFPFRSYPTGWFQVAWSGELPAGGVKPLRCFGQDLVLYRGASGAVHVLDGHCPHRGAHLGYGGCVDGEALICPNHGRCWSPDDQAMIRTWPVREWTELIYIWHDSTGGPPTWEPPRFDAAHDAAFYPAYPHGTAERQVTFPAHYLVENMADLPHIKYVHRWIDIPVFERWIEDGPCLDTVIKGTIPTPRGTEEMTLENAAWGMGLVIARMEGVRPTVELISLTPADFGHCDIRVSWWVQRGETAEPDGLAKAIYRNQTHEVLDPTGADRLIWDNLRYEARPPLAREEAKYITSYRKWMAQFYPW